MDSGRHRWRTPALLVLAVALVAWTAVGGAGAIGVYQGATSGNSLDWRVSDPPRNTWFGIDHGMERAIAIERNTGVNLEAVRLNLRRSTGFDLRLRYRAGADPEQPAIDGVKILTRINATHDGLDDRAIGGASFHFSVEKRRLRKLAVDEDAVELYRLRDDGWERVDVAVTAERFDSYVYDAQLASLDEVAVAVRHPNVEVLNPYLGRSTVEEGERTVVFAKVFNDGTTTARYPVNVTTHGTVIRRRDVQLAPGESRNVRIPVRFDVNGTFPVAVNGVSVGVIRVTPRRETASSDGETERSGSNAPPAAAQTDREPSRGMPGFTVIAAIVAALAAASRRRR